MQAPNKPPTAISRPPSAPEAEAEAMISGAPLANASRVTPAKVCERLRNLDSLESTGVKKVSAMLPSQKNAMKMKTG